LNKPIALAPLFDPADFRISAGVAQVCADGETALLPGYNGEADIARIVPVPQRSWRA